MDNAAVWSLYGLFLTIKNKHSIFASGPSCPRFDSQCSQKFSEENIGDVAEVNQWRCLEESGQWPENADQTHQVLASKHYKNIADFFSISKKRFQLFLLTLEQKLISCRSFMLL